MEETSRVHFSKVRDHTNNMPTAYINGDRFLFAKLTTDDLLPDRCTIGGYSCRIWYRAQKLQ